MTIDTSIVYFVQLSGSTRLFSLENLEALSKLRSKMKLPLIPARRNAGNQSIDSHTLNDIGPNSHELMFRLKNRDLL